MFRSPRRQALSAAAAIGATLLTVRFLPFTEAWLLPCPLRLWTELDCPGCGMTRAFAALIAGHVVDAFRLNLFAPFFAAYVVTRCAFAVRWNSWGEYRISPRAVNFLLTAAAVYGIARNIHPGAR